jgi:hypothetical protein
MKIHAIAEICTTFKDYTITEIKSTMNIGGIDKISICATKCYWILKTYRVLEVITFSTWRSTYPL